MSLSKIERAQLKASKLAIKTAKQGARNVAATEKAAKKAARDAAKAAKQAGAVVDAVAPTEAPEAAPEATTETAPTANPRGRIYWPIFEARQVVGEGWVLFELANSVTQEAQVTFGLGTKRIATRAAELATQTTLHLHSERDTIAIVDATRAAVRVALGEAGLDGDFLEMAQDYAMGEADDLADAVQPEPAPIKGYRIKVSKGEVSGWIGFDSAGKMIAASDIGEAKTFATKKSAQTFLAGHKALSVAPYSAEVCAA